MKHYTKYGDLIIGWGQHEWRSCPHCGLKVIYASDDDANKLCCSCRNNKSRRVMCKELKTSLTSVDLYWHNKIFAAVRDFYVKEMDGTVDLWRENLIKKEAFFNIVWRTALKSIIPYIEINRFPPPEHLRKIYLFRTSTVSRNRDPLVKTGAIDNLELVK